MSRFLAYAVAAICVLWFAPCCLAQLPDEQWQGRRHLVVFDFGTATDQVAQGPPKNYRMAMVTDFSYLIYQNNLGDVRYVLTSRSGSVKDSPGDFGSKLVDHRSGWVVLLDTPTTAYRSPLIPAGSATTKLEDRNVLGFGCRGVETSYEDRNHFRHVRQMWAPANGSFKDPLLEIAYIFDPDGSLGELSIGVVTRLERAQSIDGSLFQIPSGVKVVEVKP